MSSVLNNGPKDKFTYSLLVNYFRKFISKRFLVSYSAPHDWERLSYGLNSDVFGWVVNE